MWPIEVEKPVGHLRISADRLERRAQALPTQTRRRPDLREAGGLVPGVSNTLPLPKVFVDVLAFSVKPLPCRRAEEGGAVAGPEDARERGKPMVRPDQEEAVVHKLPEALLPAFFSRDPEFPLFRIPTRRPLRT